MVKKIKILPLSGLILLCCLSSGALAQSGKITNATWEEHENPKDREAYFFRMLRDPATNSIPVNARGRELEYARSLNRQLQLIPHIMSSENLYTWSQVGPSNIGGRTRALAIDVTDSNTIIAGGVSGGIWKSTDGGKTWSSRNTPDQNLSVSYIAQDPRPGHTNVWYYSTGEFIGNSANAPGAPYAGTGIYKSVDNGNTWQIIPTTENNSIFQYVSRIVVSPKTGTVFISSSSNGIYRSNDGGGSWQLVLGYPNFMIGLGSSVTANSNGIILASFGAYGYKLDGIFLSSDDGLNWKDITPSGFPRITGRTVMAFAPSDPSIAYAYAMISGGTPNVVSFIKFKFNKQGTDTLYTENRSKNINGRLDLRQGAYNMLLSVSPTDTNFVLLGSWVLYRSFNAFATPASEKKSYAEGNEVLHVDEHVASWVPGNGNEVYIGNDGGVYYTQNVRDTTGAIDWVSKNYGYITTQYYTVALRNKRDDNLVLGGTQDNGSSYVLYHSNTDTGIVASGGDGGYAFLGDNYAFTSHQNGEVIRFSYDANDHLKWQEIVKPKDASGQLFINPYAVDPDSQNVMYYPSGNTLWRNNHINSSDFQNYWQKVTGIVAPNGSVFSAVNVSHYPANIVYLGMSGLSSKSPQLLYKITYATSAAIAKNISSDYFPAGGWLNCIAVNPFNADEILVVFSNYNVPSLFYSTDGGKTFTSVGGNLDQGATGLAPSVRCALIIPTASGTYYLVGTSIGLYGTTNLNGTSTIWEPVAPQLIGNTVVDWLASRPVDRRIAVATHGRGLFVGNITDPTIINPSPPTSYALFQNYPNPFNPTTAIRYSLPNSQLVKLQVFNILGRLVKTLVDKTQAAGFHMVTFTGRNLASGMYIYRLKAGNHVIEKKMIYLK